MKVKRLGPDRPDLKPHLLSMRKFSTTFYTKYVWLTGCISTKKVYCFPCLLFGQNRPKEEAFSKIGIDDWGHMTQKCNRHEESKCHLNNCYRLSIFGRDNVLEELSAAARLAKSQHNLKVDRNRHVLSHVIDCIKFSGQHKQALIGYNESGDSDNPGIYLGLMKMQSEVDSIFKSHLDSATVFNGTSKDILNELLSVMFDVCQDKIKAEINNADFLAVILDNTSDVSQYYRNVVVLRYLVKGIIVERFWSFTEPDGGVSETISQLVMNCLKTVLPLAGDEKKLIAQCYDGAAVMSGANGGVHVQVKGIYENAHFLVIGDESVAKQRKTDNTVETVRVFSAGCDQVKRDCMDRFTFTSHLVAATLLESSNFMHFDAQFPKEALQATVEAYPFLYKKKLKSELEILYCRPELRHSAGALSLLQLVLEDGMSVMKDQFSESVQLMKVIVTTPMTSSEAGRCFSTLKRIKNFLRNSIPTDRLNALAMLSMGNQLVSTDDFNTLVIDKFSHQKKRKAKFLYK